MRTLVATCAATGVAADCAVASVEAREGGTALAGIHVMGGGGERGTSGGGIAPLRGWSYFHG
jgi:hypothetical protein